MAKPRGFLTAQTVQPETVWAAGVGCSALWGLAVLPRVGAGGGETLRCPGKFPFCRGRVWGLGGDGSVAGICTPALLGWEHEGGGEGGVSPFLGPVWAQSRHGVLVRDPPMGPVQA